MDQIWAREHVLTTLKRRVAAGEGPANAIELQHLAGMGPGDLLVTLGVLVDEGKVVMRGEEGNGSRAWELAPESGEAAALAPVDGTVSGLTPAMLAAAEQAAAPASGAQRDAAAPPRRVTLTYSVVAAMHPDVLGAMIFAGCQEASEAGAVFELVVTGP